MTCLPGRIAVVGAGAFGRFCIDSYEKSGNLKVVAVADPDPVARASVIAAGRRVDARWESVVADTNVEVVHVATPPFLRAQIVDAAFGAGKSVFCEKPLALTLAEADEMIACAERAGVALGVNYVMRHMPAYLLLEHLASSGIFGGLRTISFHNFAQAVPPEHWFWDRSKSGGILVEHGVHFLDAYARIAGEAQQVWGRIPRVEAVDVGVGYANGSIGRFYHEFAFPLAVERTVGTSMFERGSVTIEGWIPTRLSGSVLAPAQVLGQLTATPRITTVERDNVTDFAIEYPDRRAQYQAAIVAGMRDLVECHRKPAHELVVSARDARSSLAVALAAQAAAGAPNIAETVVPIEPHPSSDDDLLASPG